MFLLTVILVMSVTRVKAIDITDTHKSCMIVTPSAGKDFLFDRKLLALMSIDMNASSSLRLDWSGCTGDTSDTLV